MPSTASRDPLIGTLLDGRYDVTGRIARGGMATVYLATDRRLDREVAVKVMHAHMVDDEQFIARFIREARSAARISHPHVVNVFDQGREGDVLYLVMEYVRGITLRDALNDTGAFTPGQMLDVLIPVLEALAAAYRAGIVHRDVKPENVLLADDGGVKVADFGLARAIASSNRTYSSTGTLIGTPAYLSPELISRGVADARSDVYSSGIMAYEMLTGHPPFEGEVPVQVAFRHVNETVPPPSLEQPGLPASLDSLVLSATAQDPDDRPRDAAEYAAQARRVQRDLAEEELDREPQELSAHANRGESDPTRHVPTGGARHAQREPSGRAKHFPTVVEGLSAAAPAPHPNATQRLRSAPAGQPMSGQPRRQPASQPVRQPGRQLPEVSREEAHGVRPQTAFPTAATRVEPRRRRRTPIVLVGLLVLAMLAAAAGWYTLVGPGSYTTLPAVSGTRDQVGSTLTAAGFTPSFSNAYSESVKPGEVISTRPTSGARIRKGGPVEVVVSRGTAWTTMPQVVGKDQSAASTALGAQDVSISGEPQRVYHDTIAEGLVVSSDPAAGQRVKRGSSATLTLSKGPAPVNIPDLTGQGQSAARRALRDLGLRSKVSREYSETVPQGAVISQEPGVGNQATRGATVRLTVSLGPPLVQVPSVVGKEVAQARSTLTAAGFQVKVNNIMGGYFGKVRSQDPAPGAKAPKGSTITLTVV